MDFLMYSDTRSEQLPGMLTHLFLRFEPWWGDREEFSSENRTISGELPNLLDFLPSESLHMLVPGGQSFWGFESKSHKGLFHRLL